MTEILVTIGIMLSSAVLFVYWFRYTSLLILSARTTRDYATEIAMANQLSYMEVQSRLRENAGGDLDRLRNLLDRDYAVVRSLLEHANATEGQAALETGMLAINYRMMHAWYSVSRRFSNSAASRALDEMSQVVAHFASVMGEQAASAAAA